MTLPRALALAAALLALPLAGRAQDAAPGSAGGIAITEGFVVSTGPRAPTAAAYLTIVNGGDADRLTGASGEAARRIELHRHVRENDVARMEPIPEGVPTPAGGTVRLEPGGMHVMLMGLNAPLEPGGTVDLTLLFENAGPVAVTLPVRPPAARAGHEH